jgi:hypothetical protein
VRGGERQIAGIGGVRLAGAGAGVDVIAAAGAGGRGQRKRHEQAGQESERWPRQGVPVDSPLDRHDGCSFEEVIANRL